MRRDEIDILKHEIVSLIKDHSKSFGAGDLIQSQLKNKK